MKPRKESSARTGRSPLMLPSAKPFDPRERTLLLAVRMLEVAGLLPVSPEAQVVRQQLARAGTSVGANVEEADGAFSIPDNASPS
jgi:hypothetical protein